MSRGPDRAASAPESPGDAQRQPLSVVRRRVPRRSRVSTVVMCTLALAAALVGILLLNVQITQGQYQLCLLYTSPSPRDGLLSRMPSSA